MDTTCYRIDYTAFNVNKNIARSLNMDFEKGDINNIARSPSPVININNENQCKPRNNVAPSGP